MNCKAILAGLRKNAPSILSYTAVGGVALTGWLTDRAAKKSDKDEPFKKHWKNYIPPVIAGAGTIACIIGANWDGRGTKTGSMNARRITGTADGLIFVRSIQIVMVSASSLWIMALSLWIFVERRIDRI